MKWEYLLTNEYKIRFAIAEHYLSKCESVVDIGSYKYKLNIPNRLYCVDPNDTISDAYIGNISDWWKDIGKHLQTFGMCFLGCDIHDEKELSVIYEMRDRASTIVLETSIDHNVGMNILNNFSQWKCPSTTIELNLPNILTDNMVEYPVHMKRRFLIYA